MIRSTKRLTEIQFHKTKIISFSIFSIRWFCRNQNHPVAYTCNGIFCMWRVCGGKSLGHSRNFVYYHYTNTRLHAQCQLPSATRCCHENYMLQWYFFLCLCPILGLCAVRVAANMRPVVVRRTSGCEAVGWQTQCTMAVAKCSRVNRRVAVVVATSTFVHHAKWFSGLLPQTNDPTAINDAGHEFLRASSSKHTHTNHTCTLYNDVQQPWIMRVSSVNMDLHCLIYLSAGRAFSRGDELNELNTTPSSEVFSFSSDCVAAVFECSIFQFTTQEWRKHFIAERWFDKWYLSFVWWLLCSGTLFWNRSKKKKKQRVVLLYVSSPSFAADAMQWQPSKQNFHFISRANRATTRRQHWFLPDFICVDGKLNSEWFQVRPLQQLMNLLFEWRQQKKCLENQTVRLMLCKSSTMISGRRTSNRVRYDENFAHIFSTSWRAFDLSEFESEQKKASIHEKRTELSPGNLCVWWFFYKGCPCRSNKQPFRSACSLCVHCTYAETYMHATHTHTPTIDGVWLGALVGTYTK